MMLKYIVVISFAIMEYALLINGQSSGVSNSDIANILTDLTSLRILLLRSNENIYALQGELAMANQNIYTLQSGGALANQKIQTLQSQLAISNQDIHILQNQVALANRDIRFLKQDATKYRNVINKLKYNQTYLSAELKYLRGQDAQDGTLTKRSVQGVCGCQMEISNLSQQFKAVIKANNNTNIQIQAEIHDLRNDQGALQNGIGEIWKEIRAADAKFELVNKTIQQAAMNTNTTTQVKAEIDGIKGDIYSLKKDHSGLRNDSSHIWKKILEADAKFELVNKTIQQLIYSSPIIKNNSIAITRLAHKLGNYVNQINSLNATMQHQQHQQEQQTNKLSSSVANLISSGEDVCFTAYLSSHPGNVSSVIIYDRVITNKGSGYNTEDGVFTAPRDGMYLFIWNGVTIGGQTCLLDLYKNGRDIGLYAYSDARHQVVDSSSMSVVLELIRGDRVWVRNVNCRYSFPGVYMSFSGCKI